MPTEIRSFRIFNRLLLLPPTKRAEFPPPPRKFGRYGPIAFRGSRFRSPPQLRRRHAEILFAEYREIGGSGETVARGDFRNAFIGIPNIAQDTFGTTFVEPLAYRPLEFRFEFSLKIAYAHVGQRRKTAHVIDMQIILKYEILEIIAVADNGFQ